MPGARPSDTAGGLVDISTSSPYLYCGSSYFLYSFLVLASCIFMPGLSVRQPANGKRWHRP
ncbi:hypothetical protein BLL52_1688 [Rhodoferax antarcticus ANT.BR]|uniref:Uncharacterized protein n=1 Tax=Rhodoferax antarcticus ANT.BR TaxID=1111071 RepID=A0A1Q8YG25_9BURK|nr:hypothetical protein BLL52_1688 [Rhodoferax antarcticus ANT.BR]